MTRPPSRQKHPEPPNARPACAPATSGDSAGNEHVALDAKLIQPEPAPARSSRAVRVELPPPPYPVLSWAVLVAYTIVAVEGAHLACSYPWSTSLSWDTDVDPAVLNRAWHGQLHLCCIYVFETAMVFTVGWCAMSPGWTRNDIFVHHVPYVLALVMVWCEGALYRWLAPVVVVLLTPANEGMFVAVALGAPKELDKFRRLFGFFCVLILFIVESWTLARNTLLHYQLGPYATTPSGSALKNAVLDQLCWGGICYHALLLRMYVRRWKKTRCL